MTTSSKEGMVPGVQPAQPLEARSAQGSGFRECKKQHLGQLMPRAAPALPRSGQAEAVAELRTEPGSGCQLLLELGEAGSALPAKGINESDLS